MRWHHGDNDWFKEETGDPIDIDDSEYDLDADYDLEHAEMPDRSIKPLSLDMDKGWEGFLYICKIISTIIMPIVVFTGFLWAEPAEAIVLALFYPMLIAILWVMG